MKNFITALLLSAVLASCSTLEGKETAGEYIDDSAITTKVKAAILKDSSLSAFDIGVETMQNTVQLSGFVDSKQKAARAEKLARSVKGVQAVSNDLVVKNRVVRTGK